MRCANTPWRRGIGKSRKIFPRTKLGMLSRKWYLRLDGGHRTEKRCANYNAFYCRTSKLFLHENFFLRSEWAILQQVCANGIIARRFPVITTNILVCFSWVKCSTAEWEGTSGKSSPRVPSNPSCATLLFYQTNARIARPKQKFILYKIEEASPSTEEPRC